MDPVRFERFQRAASWRSLAVMYAMLLVMDVIIHRLITGTWYREPWDWLAWAIGMVVGVALVKLIAAWMARRQRAHHPSP